LHPAPVCRLRTQGIVQTPASPAYLHALRTLPNLDILFALAGLLPAGDLPDALEKDSSNIREFARERLLVTLSIDVQVKERIAEAFREAPTAWLQGRRKKLLTCHRAHIVATRTPEGLPLQATIVPHACNTPACPTCNRRKSLEYFLRAFKALTKQLDKIEHLSHAVFTVKNCPWGRLEDTIVRLLIVWQRMQHSDDWKAHVSGFFWGLEITINRRSQTWHPHIHALLHSRFWQKDKLKATWKHLLSHQVLFGNTHIKAATREEHNIAAAIHECTKYITPGFEEPGVAPPQLWELATAMHRKRRKGSGGTLRIPTKEKPEVRWRIEGGLKKVLERARENTDSVLTRTVIAAIWSDRAQLLEIATSYPPSLWAIAPKRKTKEREERRRAAGT